jgi:signal transduction histidine kinase
MARRTRAMDWSRAPTGTLDQWPSSLRVALSVCFAAPVPMQLWWGPSLTLFYNDACIPFIDHPSALGRAAREVWATTWPAVGAVVERAFSDAVHGVRGDVVETFAGPTPGRGASTMFRLSCVRGDDGSIDGLLWVEEPARSLHLARARSTAALQTRARRQAEARTRELYQRLAAAEAAERRRIARDIHDTVGQHLTALRLGVEALKVRLARQPALAALTLRLEGLARELDDRIDFVIWDLRPAALDNLGLFGALESLVHGFAERFGIQAIFDGDRTTAVQLSKEAELHLYRLAQEALHNIVKHAKATRVLVSLRKEDGASVLSVEDNGRGFAVGHSSPASLHERRGLLSMRERAQLAGGKLDITSSPRAGTSIVVRIPAVRAVGDRSAG